jgi:hypothetical protein
VWDESQNASDAIAVCVIVIRVLLHLCCCRYLPQLQQQSDVLLGRPLLRLVLDAVLLITGPMAAAAGSAPVAPQLSSRASRAPAADEAAGEVGSNGADSGRMPFAIQLDIRARACLPACLPACLLACLPACPPDRPPGQRM